MSRSHCTFIDVQLLNDLADYKAPWLLGNFGQKANYHLNLFIEIRVLTPVCIACDEPVKSADWISRPSGVAHVKISIQDNQTRRFP